MLWSKLHIPTLRESPADAEVISHQLMLRAGMIRKLSSGIYSFLPLGWRVIRKMEQIIREEMDAAGGLEVSLPVIQPKELWEQTGRWEAMGKNLARLRDRHDNEFCLQPTAEEVITDLVKKDIQSYRQLPVNLYQIQTKFRDEIRPRFGLMRCREFIMKDAYSFDLSKEEAIKSYEEMRRAYRRIFSRTGLKFRAVDADTGDIGGNQSEQFHVLAQSGEDEIVSAENSAYAANQEKARSLFQHETLPDPGAVEEFDTPEARTIEDLDKQFGIKAENSIKTMIATDGEKVVVVLLRGDHELNEIKLAAHLSNQHGLQGARLARDDELKAWDLPKGSLGPVKFPKEHILVCDNALSPYAPYVCGANQAGKHFKNVVLSRDVGLEESSQLTIHNVSAGEMAPDGSGPLRVDRGIEVGHVFYLGTKYSKALKLEVATEDRKSSYPEMGCYGIGVGRTVAACIEQNHDKWGIIWPLSLAPYELSIVSLGSGRPMEEAERLYKSLTAKGLEVVWDDRDLSPGVKLKDSDLVGIPYQVVIGDRGLKNEEVEWKIRAGGEKTLVPLSNIEETVLSCIEAEKKRIHNEVEANS